MSTNYEDILRALAQASVTRRKCFVSYYGGDSTEVDTFVSNFKDVFIPKVIGVTDGDDFIDSDDSDYIMSKIREKYLGDSTVTLVMIGSCTHSRRYIDWEIKASLRQGSYTPNGLLGILLPSMGNSGHLPDRFKENWENTADASYALYRSYPSSSDELRKWIEAAHARRSSHANFIKNSQSMMKYSRNCKVHKVTH
jgi:hypothetical protein